MRKRILVIMLTLVLLNGCSDSPDVLLSYSQNDNLTNIENENIADMEVADYYASDLAVIPDELNHMDEAGITAEAALLVDSSDNKVIYANNVYERLYPASLTKLVTALVVLRNANLSDIVTISHNASHITESGAKLCGFKEGDKISMETLLNSLLVYSGNDAGVAIAEHVGGSVEEFAKMMNETAVSIGAVHSNFVNPHGLHDDNHYTTAYDLYLFFHELLSYKEFTSIINQSSYTAQYTDAAGKSATKKFTTTNRYLKGTENSPDGVTVVGGKTGTTSKAGNCLILCSKNLKDKTYISLLLHANSGDSLYDQMTMLLEKVD